MSTTINEPSILNRSFDKNDLINLAFEPDSEFLREYFEKLPKEKKQAIVQKLQNVIVF